MAYENVIVFGAGSSCDAGIPLLNNFVDTMWGYAVRGSSPCGRILDGDRKLLERANDIRYGLERYNSRANFNMRNLEDILSLLYFEALAGGEAVGKYQTWIKAITRTIELSCKHPHRVAFDPRVDTKNAHYHWLWHTILGTDLHETPPALITFNYDLVLERALWDYFHFLPDQHLKPAGPSCKVRYFLRPYDFVIRSVVYDYDTPVAGSGRTAVQPVRGYRADIDYRSDASVEVPYLKLHGSLNWCGRTTAGSAEPVPEDAIPATGPTQAVETPLILPPVFNKMYLEDVGAVWEKALEILRGARHIVIVGYSLPRTDVYMQYFLKSAVGPNSNLQWIIVFDPALFRTDAAAEEMRARYRDCFSPQFNERIVFRPDKVVGVDERDRTKGLGTLFHFVQALKYNAGELLFVP